MTKFFKAYRILVKATDFRAQPPDQIGGGFN